MGSLDSSEGRRSNAVARYRLRHWGVDAPEKQRRTIRRPTWLFGRALGPRSCCSGERTRRWRMDTGPDAGRRSTRVFAGRRVGV